MSKTIKIVRTTYLYLATFVSLLFLAIGTGTFTNSVLKAYVFPKAEKGGYSRCNEQPPVYGLDGLKASPVATEDQKTQIDNLISDYENWKKNNTGEECYSAERQGKMVDSLTMVLVAFPIFLFHWKIAKKEKEEKEI